MPKSKVHPLKNLRNHLVSRTRLLVLGPLEVDAKMLKKVTQTLKPDFILLVDGGIRHRSLLTTRQQKISLSVGDGDSIREEAAGPIELLLPVKKDYSDLEFALNALAGSKNQIKELALFGFSSHTNEKRIDHLIFNLSSIAKITTRLKIASTLDGRFLFLPPGKKALHYRGIFSVMAFSGTRLKITGQCEYQLPDWTKLGALSSRGLSNKGYGKIVIESKKTLLLYFPGSNFSL